MIHGGNEFLIARTWDAADILAIDDALAAGWTVEGFTDGQDGLYVLLVKPRP